MYIVPTQNKFTILGNFLPLPSKLATFAQTTSSSSNDHSSSKSDSISSPFPGLAIPTFAQPSQVLHKYKSVQPKLFPIEHEYQDMKNVIELVTKVFPPGWDFMPEEQNKSQNFYEFILVDYGSVILSHTPCKFDPEHKWIAFFLNVQLNARIERSAKRVLYLDDLQHYRHDIYIQNMLAFKAIPQNVGLSITRDYRRSDYGV
jgi:hypothetical protein